MLDSVEDPEHGAAEPSSGMLLDLRHRGGELARKWAPLAVALSAWVI